MAATGVTVSDAAIAEFNEIKLRKSAKFMIYHIVDGKIVTETVSQDPSFDAFLELLPVNDCRYAIYDMEFETNDGRPGQKLVFIAW